MSKVKIEGNASGTGTLTIAAPNTNTDRTLTLPDGAGELLTTTGDGSQLTGISSYADSDALSLFNASGSAPVYACRAWVNFNGQGTVAIRASGNVSSITDNSLGNYTINFTTAMPDANYSTAVGCGYSGIFNSTSSTCSTTINAAPSTSSLNIMTFYEVGGTSAEDIDYVQVTIFR